VVSDDFDCIILGGGPGGYAAALYGASAGMSIAMVEEQRVGGTCLHHGCIPAKELLQTAEVLRTVRNAGEFGVQTSAPALDLAASQTRKHAVIDRLTSGLESLLKHRKVAIVPGTGTLSPDARTITVSDGSKVRGRNVIVATGSAPRALPVDGLDFDGKVVLSSDHVLEVGRIPPRVAVIGGGAIGCEFASFLVDSGAQVTMLEVLPQILTGVDQQVAQVVSRALEKRGVKVQTGVSVNGFDRGTAGGGTLRFTGKNGDEQLIVDQVVVSVGRRPRTENAGLDAAGIKIDERGFIVVDGNMRTSADGVYAVGDVVATPQLAHVAFSEAIVAIKTMLGENPLPLDYDKVPWGIYCHPEVAFCGLTEAQAKDRGYNVVTSVHRWGGIGRALIIGETEGIMKIVAEKDGPILGVHVAGPWATELIAEGYLSVNWEATPADVGLLIHAHPTLSELFGESVLALTGRSLHS
jgi:dihydrolipoamide dehydrogenase